MSIGESYEGRDMKVIEIRKAGVGKPNVWIEAGNSIVTSSLQCIYINDNYSVKGSLD